MDVDEATKRPNTGRMDDLEIEVAQRIQRAMLDAERSPHWTAERAGIPRTTFNRKLKGVGEFSFRELLRIAHVLRVPPAAFLPASFTDAA